LLFSLKREIIASKEAQMVNKSENEFFVLFCFGFAHNNVSITQQMTLKAKARGADWDGNQREAS